MLPVQGEVGLGVGSEAIVGKGEKGGHVGNGVLGGIVTVGGYVGYGVGDGVATGAFIMILIYSCQSAYAKSNIYRIYILHKQIKATYTSTFTVAAVVICYTHRSFKMMAPQGAAL